MRWDWVHLLLRPLLVYCTNPRRYMMVTGATGGLNIGRGNRSTRSKLAPSPLCPPQIPHDQTRARTRATAVGSQRLTAWAMARPSTQKKRRKELPAIRRYKSTL
jgi:hypothetical protein